MEHRSLFFSFLFYLTATVLILLVDLPKTFCSWLRIKLMEQESKHFSAFAVRFHVIDPVMLSGEFSFCLFIIYAYECTCRG